MRQAHDGTFGISFAATDEQRHAIIRKIFASYQQYFLTFAVMVLAQAIYVMVGFGSGLIALGCLALMPLNLTDLTITLLLVSLPAEGFVVARSWQQIAWPETARICIGVGIGALVGTFFLTMSAPVLMLRLLSLLLVVSGAGFLCSSMGSRVVSWPRWMQVPVGAASGLLSGLPGAGGRRAELHASCLLGK